MKRFLLFVAMIISGLGLFAQNIGDNISIDYVRYVLKFTVTSTEPAECEVICESKASSAAIVAKIPSTVTIGEKEFNVTSIGEDAFYDKNFSGVEFPDGLVSIGKNAFNFCGSLVSVEIPNTVVTIGDHAFHNCKSLESITFEENSHLTSIGDFALGRSYSNIIPLYESIEIPSSVTHIGKYVFQNCTNLKNVTFEDNSQLVSIGDNAFSACENLELIDFGENSQLDSIGQQAFYMSGLRCIEIPASVTYIGKNVFEYSGLRSIVCHAVTPPDANNAFSSSLLSDIYVPAESVELYNNEYPWYIYKINDISNSSVIVGMYSTIDYGEYSLDFIITDVENAKCGVVCSKHPEVMTTITIPSSATIDGVDYSVTSVEYKAFNGCENIIKIEIPNTVTTIYGYAFNNCYNLESLELPSSVTSLSGSYIFDYTLKSLICHAEVAPSADYSSFYDANSNLVVYVPSASVEQYLNAYFWHTRTIKEISSSSPVEGGYEIVDYGNYSLKYTVKNLENTECEVECVEFPNAPTAVVIPSTVNIQGVEFNVTSLKDNIFKDCTYLTSIEIPSGVTYIGSSAFRNCSSLANVTFGENSQLTSIESNAFYNCSSLTDIEIPSGVTSIGGSVFRGCSSLANVTFGENSQLTYIGSSVFYNCSSLANVTFGENSQLTYIGSSVFYNCSSLTDIEIPSGVTSIELDAFIGCSSLANVTIGENSQLTYIGSSAFKNCSSLVSIEIPSGVTAIGYSTFYDCSSLANVTLGENSQLTSIESYAFCGCSSLESIEIPSGVTSIGNYAFLHCSSLTSIEIPSGVTSIGSYAFCNCSSLTDIEIPSGVTSIGNNTFYNCSSLTNVTIGENSQLTHISDYAFYKCSSLASIEIPSGVTSIGNNTFYNCSSLANVTIGENSQLTSIGSNAFYNCSSLASIEIPSGVTSIGASAFYNCSSLASIEIPSGVTSIGGDAFYNCSNLETINVEEGNTVYDSRNNCNALIETASNTLLYGCKNTVIPNTVTSIGNYAFINCSSLTDIEIPSSVTSIGSDAFCKCSNLESVELPASITRIGDYAFYYSQQLLIIICHAETVPQTSSNAFANINSNATIYVPEASLELYINASPWNNYTIKKYTSAVNDVTTIDYGTYSLTFTPMDTVSNECEVMCTKKPTVKTMISIPDTVTLNGKDYVVTSIRKHAFKDCTEMSCLEIPNTVTYIGDEAFARNYYSYTFKTMICHAENVPLTAVSAFNGINSLGIYVPEASVDSYKNTNPWKNYYINKYESSAVNGSSVTIDYEDYSLIFVVTNEYDKECEVLCAKEPVSDSIVVVIPASVTIGGEDFDVTSIGASAFYNCSSLASIEIPSSVTSIGASAFYNCSSLASIEIPSSVTSIGGDAFHNCSNLETINVEEGNTVYDSRNNCNALIETASNTLLYGCKNTVIPNTVTSIGGFAFYNCSSLTSIEIPSGVTSIGSYAFYNCSSLESIEIPSGVTSIEYMCFYGCSSLTNVTFGENSQLTSIGGSVFRGCSSLESIEIPSGVTSIEYYAFYNCSSLASIEIPSSVTSIGELAFSGCSSLASIEIPSGVTSIEWGAFYGCSSLTDMEIPSGVTSIGIYAFYNCSSLTDIEIPSGVTSIGTEAFYNCSSLTNVTFGENSQLTSIGSEAFYNCSSFTEIEIPSGVTSIEYYAFGNCSSLANVTFGENSQLTYISDYAFYGCSSLTDIEIPSGVTSIGESAFRECSSLASIEIPSGVTSIEWGAFYGCSSLASIEIPSSVTSIEYMCFYGCSSLTNVTFGENSQLTSIGGSVFRGCSSLESIEIPSGVTSIEYMCFYGCSSLASIEIPSSVTTIGSSAFGNCSKLTNFRCYAEAVPQTSSDALYGVSSNMIIYVPEASVELYETSVPWYNFIIMAIPTHNVGASVNPEESGSVSGAGIYMDALSANLKATANFGYLFENWTENGEIVSTEPEYSFEVLEDRYFVANFIDAQYVQIAINIENAGSVSGIGTYNSGETVTVTATPNEGYTFLNWTENGEIVSEEMEYSFTIEADRELVANFIEIYDIVISMNIEGAGSVTGAGTYNNGETVVVTVSPNENYAFLNWTMNEEIVSEEMEYSFVITEDVELVANFIETYDVTIAMNIEGSGVVEGSGTYNKGETVTVTATPNEGYIFINWTENGEIVTTETEYSFEIANDRNFVANFIAIYDVTISINIECSGLVSGEGTFTDGETVTVTATPNEGYTFLNWTENGEIVSEEMEYSFTIEADRELVANFIEIYDVAISMNIEGAGSVTGAGTYTKGSTVEVSATANENYAFISWTMNEEIVSEEMEYSFVITEDVELVANFIETYDVTIAMNIEGSGVVEGSGTYNKGETVTVTATPNEGYIFINWTENGEIVTTETEYSFEIANDRNFVANFIAIYDVTISMNIEGSGLVSGEGTFTDGETVTVTATPNEGYTFLNWTENGEIVSEEMEYSFTIEADRELVANFIEIYDVVISMNIEGAGSVTGAGTYTKGSTVEVSATANENYAFISWTMNEEIVSEEMEYSFVITEDVELVANFIETYDVTIAMNIEGSGVVEGSGTYNKGETVTVTATPNEGYIFVNWTENGEIVTTETEYSFEIANDRNFVANFIAIYDVTITMNMEEAGSVTGEGTYNDGETVTVTATPNEGYKFVNWTENGEVVSEEMEYSFVITEDVELVANFVSTEGMGEQYAKGFNVYPNPTNVNHVINLGMICDRVEVYNSAGVKLADYSNVDEIDGLDAAGIYIIRIINDKDVMNSRIIVR